MIFCTTFKKERIPHLKKKSLIRPSAVICKPQELLLSNGAIECTNSHTFNSQCNATCNVGYQLLGDGSFQCGSDGSDSDGVGAWTNSSTPICRGTSNIVIQYFYSISQFINVFQIELFV